MKALPILILSILLITAANIYADNHWIDKGQYLENDQDAGEIRYMKLSADGKKIYTLSDSATVRLWDIESGNILFEKDLKPPDNRYIFGMDISSDEKYFVFCDFQRHHKMTISKFDLKADTLIYQKYIKFYLNGGEELINIENIAPIIDEKNNTVFLSYLLYMSFQHLDWYYLGKMDRYDYQTGNEISNIYSKGGRLGCHYHPDFFLYKDGSNLVVKDKSDTANVVTNLDDNGDFVTLGNSFYYGNSYDHSRIALFSDLKILKVFDYYDNVSTEISSSQQMWLQNKLPDFISFTKDNRYLIFPQGRKIIYWDVQYERIADTLLLNSSAKFCSAYSKGESEDFILGGSDGSLRIIKADITSDNIKAVFKTDREVYYQDSSVTFYNFSTGKFDSVLWDFGDGETSNEFSPTHQYKDKGFYTPKLIIGNGIKFDSLTVNPIKIIPHLIPDFEADITSGQAPLAVNFKNKSTGNISKIEWYFDDETTTNFDEHLHIFENAGHYTIRLDIYDELGMKTLIRKDYIHAKQNNDIYVRNDYYDTLSYYDNKPDSFAETFNGTIGILGVSEGRIDIGSSSLNHAYKYSITIFDKFFEEKWYNLLDRNQGNDKINHPVSELYAKDNEYISFYTSYTNQEHIHNDWNYDSYFGQILFDKYENEIFYSNRGSDHRNNDVLNVDYYRDIKDSNKILIAHNCNNSCYKYIVTEGYYNRDYVFPCFISSNTDYCHGIRPNIFNITEKDLLLHKRHSNWGFICKINYLSAKEEWSRSYLADEDIYPVAAINLSDKNIAICGWSNVSDSSLASVCITDEAGVPAKISYMPVEYKYNSIARVNDETFAVGGSLFGRMIVSYFDIYGNNIGNYKVKNKKGEIKQMKQSVDGSLLVLAEVKKCNDSSGIYFARIDHPQGIIASVKQEDIREGKYYLSIFPNPASSTINLSGVDTRLNKSNTALYNQLGQDVSGLVEFSGTSSIDVSALPDGVYYIRVNIDEQIIVRQMVVVK